MVLIILFSGLFSFIYGLKLTNISLKDAVDYRIKFLLHKITENRLFSLVVGMLITVLFQSSSATIVLIMSFVNAGLLGVYQALSLVLGANIGTTVTGQLFSFNLENYLWIFFLIGVICYFIYYKSEDDKWLSYTGVFIGFGLIFFGLNLLTAAFAPLKDTEFFLRIIFRLSGNSFLALGSGVAGTAILQSSSAFIGVILALAKQNLIQLSTALRLLLGSNIGTCITAVIAAVNSSATAKKIAIGHIIFNFVGALIFLPMVNFYSSLITLTSSNLARQIANGHTGFNLINAILFFLLFDRFYWLVESITYAFSRT
ncbi:Na/Pi cotransporter family protein [Acetohalobium arabaticum]|uniref:Na+/Picotransporter n=1 Tax=Acetohalobium arabaticum (strain ATCC 49924 / DSM 5501 / Z-7288) TaxID=574087 RepID=D9QRD2_ACEAZ|nr:Na/Pi symporter [Acetohalobium arabaticum]ADL13073.1 Na+/Picotransporter [Acetohalobium arabaticum DSM 5501]